MVYIHVDSILGCTSRSDCGTIQLREFALCKFVDDSTFRDVFFSYCTWTINHYDLCNTPIINHISFKYLKLFNKIKFV